MPVQWKDGWPRITGPGEVIPWTMARPKLPAQRPPLVPTNGPFTVRDEFERSALPLHWMMMRNPRSTWWRTQGGALHLRPRPVQLGDNGNPSFLARRQQHMFASATTRLTFAPSGDAEAGLTAFQNDEYYYLVALGQKEGRTVIRLKRRAGPGDRAGGGIVREIPTGLRAGAPVHLRIDARGGEYDFRWSADGRAWQPIMTGADGTILSTKTSGGFIGATFGLYAFAGSQGEKK